MSNPPLSSFKKLIVLALRLLGNLHKISLVNAVPYGLKDCECKRITSCKRPLVAYVPKKDIVQEMVSALKNDQSLKTTIGEGAELRLSIWHSGMRKAFLMHVGSALDTIKKQGLFKANKEAHELYVEQKDLAKQVKATLAELDGTTSEDAGTSRKPSKKNKEGAVMADASESNLQANLQFDLEKAKEATENAKAKAESAAKDMFQFYANLLSVDSKYAWNKIFQEQMQSNPYVDLQGVSNKGPRGLLRKSFDDCMMFHLLTVFPNNGAEQERYYLMNVLKKPQRISVHQFVQRVEQLNSYIAQLPCWFYSPSVKSKTTPANVLFTEADLASQFLRMCPHMWQDQFNLHKKGMTPVDMCLLLVSLKAIERLCTQEKSNAQSSKKASNKGKNRNKGPGTDATIRVSKKACTKKHCNLCKKH
jgi:hypothetical protein